MSWVDLGLRVIHWLMAALIIAMLIGGQWMVVLGDRLALKWLLFDLHESLGLLLFLMLLLRLWLRHRALQPLSLTNLATPLRRMAQGSHVLLYALMLLIPLTGYLQAAPYGVNLFGLEVPAPRGRFTLAGHAFLWHQLLSKFLILLVTVHILAALAHIFRRP